MFTGIIEEVGKIVSASNGSNSAKLKIAANTVLQDTKVGDSIAVNGVCLTVTSLTGSTFTADVMHETLNRSSLGGLRPNDSVNLERALSLTSRLGGHIVSGHIDSVGKVLSITNDDNAIIYTINAHPDTLKYIVEKGSIAIQGISLTVTSVTSSSFSVSVIPHTQQQTTLTLLKVGSAVNLECDILAKYIEKLAMVNSNTNNSEGPAASQKSASKLTAQYLQALGF